MRTLTGEYPYQRFGFATSDWSFIPDPLTEKYFAHPDDELMLLLISAHEALGTLEGMVLFAPNASPLRALLLKKEACCSLQIDNKGISFYEMMQMASVEQKKYDVIKRTCSALEVSIEKPFAIPTLCDILDELAHLKAEIDFSKLSEDQLPVCKLFNNADREKIEIKDHIYAAMRDISQFYQQKSLVDILTKIALIHYQFEMLHPFPNFNGIVGRTGILMLFFEAGYKAAPFLCISDFLFQNTEAYFSQLSSTNRNGDYLSWIKFMIHGFVSAAKKSIRLIEQYEALIVKDNARVKKFAFSDNTLLVYDYFKANLAAEIPQVAKDLNLSFNTVSKVVELLEKKKILELVNKQVRHRKFIYRKAADLFV